jgi:hypothetical protein
LFGMREGVAGLNLPNLRRRLKDVMPIMWQG